MEESKLADRVELMWVEIVYRLVLMMDEFYLREMNPFVGEFE